MITVKAAWYKQGYSRIDHLLDDSELEDVVGAEFRSVAEARKAAERLRAPRCKGFGNYSPIGLQIRFADKSEATF